MEIEGLTEMTFEERCEKAERIKQQRYLREGAKALRWEYA